MTPFPQQLMKRLKLKRKDVQQLITRGQQLQAEEGLGETLQQDLQSLENTLSKMEQNMDSQEQSLEVSSVCEFVVTQETSASTKRFTVDATIKLQRRKDNFAAVSDCLSEVFLTSQNSEGYRSVNHCWTLR